MPSPVASKKEHIIRILIGQLGQGEIHTRRIAVWHNKKAGFPGKWLYCAVHVTILSDVMAEGTDDRMGTPIISEWLRRSAAICTFSNASPFEILPLISTNRFYSIFKTSLIDPQSKSLMAPSNFFLHPLIPK